MPKGDIYEMYHKLIQYIALLTIIFLAARQKKLNNVNSTWAVYFKSRPYLQSRKL